jgi:all-trans-8'-apo-beta-carotenal 15,15'-oxygenase
VAEQKAGKALFKGAFSTGNPSGGWFNNPFDLKFKNVANTHVTQVRRKAWGACPVSK